ncbi:MAG: hypothetical protein ACK4N5_13965 [Myxococcales bacterium]
MQRKGTTQVEAIEAKDVTTALKRTRSLASDEEKAVRMRYGAGVDVKAPLERHGEKNEDLRDELMLLELELFRAYRQHQKAQAARATPAPQPSRTKEKIVRALRKKK